MMKRWTKFLPLILIQWYARKKLATNSLNGRKGVWAYRDVFIVSPIEEW